MTRVPEPRYARPPDGAYLAYQVVGDGPVDLLFELDYFAGLDMLWENPDLAAEFRGLASFSRLILYDRRGIGLSSRNVRDRPARHPVRGARPYTRAYDTPAEAIRCGVSIVNAIPATGLHVRAGIHTGECHLAGGKVAGLAVAIGARVAALAAADEVLVTSTVKDLVTGSGLTSEEAGEHELKGVPDRWRLYRVLA